MQFESQNVKDLKRLCVGKTNWSCSVISVSCSVPSHGCPEWYSSFPVEMDHESSKLEVATEPRGFQSMHCTWSDVCTVFT